MSDSEKSIKKKRGNPNIKDHGFSKDRPPTKETIEKSAETRKKIGQFRTRLLTMLENEYRIIDSSAIIKFVDKFNNEIKSPDLDKVYAVYYRQHTYDTILRKLVSKAAIGDRHATEQVIQLAQGYREADAQAKENFAEFLEGLKVTRTPALDITPYDELQRTID